MITEMDAEKALHAIYRMADPYAKAKSQRIYLEEFRKSQKAILMAHSDGKTVDARESYAYSHPDYLGVLEGLKVAVEQEEALRWKIVSAQAQIDIFRSQEASRRADKL